MKTLSLIIIAAFSMFFTVGANEGKTGKPVKEVAGNIVTGDKEEAAAYALKGTIYDPVCDEAVSGATITIDGKKYYSDLSGNFAIPGLAKGKYKVDVDFISYQSRTMEIVLDENQDIKIEIKQQ